MPTTIATSDPTAPIAETPSSAPVMRRAPYRDEIIYGIGALLNVDALDLPPETSGSWARRVNSWVRKGFHYWQWKQLEITEERAFRQLYHDDLGYLADLDEVYFIDTGSYYACIYDTVPGESPATAPEKWSAIAAMDRTIAFDQFGKRAIGKMIEINRGSDPTLYRTAARRQIPFTVTGRGITVDSAGPTVWLTYQIRQPYFTHVLYDSATQYYRDYLVYDPLTGECYRALRDGHGEDVSGRSYWLLQEMPEFLSDYVVHGVASDFVESEPARRALRLAAEEALIGEINGEIEQGVRSSYSTLSQARDWRACGWSNLEIPYALVEVYPAS